MRVTKIPMVGAGSGYGVVVDKRTNTRSYIRVSRLEVGGGLGARKFKVVIVYEDEKHLDRIAAGTWHYDAGAEVAAGSASAGGAATKSGKGYQAFRLAESGATATVTLRAAHAKPYLRD
jgi:lipid-binding SYLF domain-containing protein